MSGDRWVPSSRMIQARRENELKRLLRRKEFLKGCRFAQETMRSCHATRAEQVLELELMLGDDWDDGSLHEA